MADLAWLIPVFPWIAFMLMVFVTRRWKTISGHVAILGSLTSLLPAVFVFREALSGVRVEQSIPWLPLADKGEQGPVLQIGFLVDPLTAVMLIVVTSVSLLVIFYSQGYMHGDPGYSRYFAFISLFCMSMLGLVLANNLLALYIFWELVGLCSYLLIGFWYQKPEAGAAKKAFIVTRLGDFGLLIGILMLWARAGTLEFAALEEMIAAGRFDAGFLSLVGLLVLAGAIGKSAQFPPHVWLPDATRSVATPAPTDARPCSRWRSVCCHWLAFHRWWASSRSSICSPRPSRRGSPGWWCSGC